MAASLSLINTLKKCVRERSEYLLKNGFKAEGSFFGQCFEICLPKLLRKIKKMAVYAASSDFKAESPKNGLNELC